MGKFVFVPLSDELLYDYPEQIASPVIPFDQHARAAKTQPAAVVSVEVRPGTTETGIPTQCRAISSSSLESNGLDKYFR
jgi:hypothetical protein